MPPVPLLSPLPSPQALEYYSKALSQLPNQSSTYSAMGFTHHLMGHFQEAIEYYHRALGFKSNDTFSLQMLDKALQEVCQLPSPGLVGSPPSGPRGQLPVPSLFLPRDEGPLAHSPSFSLFAPGPGAGGLGRPGHAASPSPFNGIASPSPLQFTAGAPIAEPGYITPVPQNPGAGNFGDGAQLLGMEGGMHRPCPSTGATRIRMMPPGAPLHARGGPRGVSVGLLGDEDMPDAGDVRQTRLSFSATGDTP